MWILIKFKQVVKQKNSDVTNCPIRKLNNAGENSRENDYKFNKISFPKLEHNKVLQIILSILIFPFLEHPTKITLLF